MKILNLLIVVLVASIIFVAAISLMEEKRTERINAQNRLLKTRIIQQANDRLFLTSFLLVTITGGGLIIAVIWIVFDRAYYNRKLEGQGRRTKALRHIHKIENHYHYYNIKIEGNQRRKFYKQISQGNRYIDGK